jgi:putative chitinase
LSKSVGIDFVKNPDLLLEEANALIAALWFWNKNKLNVLADKNDILTITKRINGGYMGIEDRKKKFSKYIKILS